MFFSHHGRLLCDIVLANHRCGRLSEPQHRTHRAIFFHRGLRVNKYVYDICIKFVYIFFVALYIYNIKGLRPLPPTPGRE